MGVAAPSQDFPDVQRETELKMACIAAVEPEWDEHEGLQALEAGFKITNPNLYDGLCISPSMMAEVLAASEAKGIYDYDAALSQKKARKEHMEATHAELANVYFQKPPPWKWAAKDKKIPRWLPPQEELKSNKVGEWICKHLAPGVQLKIDDYNGRFRMIAEDLSWKSVSWTKRGWQQTAAEVLYWGWKFHQDCHGVPPPYSLEAPLTQFEHEGVVD